MNERDGKRIFVAGHPGQGKTNLLQVLTRDASRLVVIDPKHSWRLNQKTLGLYLAKDMRDFLAVFKKSWKEDGAFRIVFEPEPLEAEGQSSDIAQLIFELQRPYLENPGMGKTCLVIDEISEALPNVRQSKNCRGILRAASMGREIGLDVYGGTQYPVNCSLEFRRLVDRALILPVVGQAIKAVDDLAAGNPEVIAAVEKLERHHYVSIDRITGEFSVKKPAPLIS
jgi:hypothetical protein